MRTSRESKAWISYAAARFAAAAADAAILAAAHIAAFWLRFDFNEPPWGWAAVAKSFGTVCAVYLPCLLATGCLSRAWRRVSWRDLPRFAAAMGTGCAILAAMRFCLPDVSFSHIRPPYSVTVVSCFFAATGMLVARLACKAYSMASAASGGALIERGERTFDNSAAARFLAGRTVMVTGAGGSIGSEIVVQCAMAGAARILMVERCERALYEIDRRMRQAATACPCVPLMRDAADRAAMEKVFDSFRPSVVLHAAACKHVPMVELNPEEGWRNNVESTRILAGLAAAHGTERFVLVSTDKAVNPVSVMGKSKREAERIVMEAPGETSFCAVRFGNVYGSSGSVVPLFREQIASGGPVTVTHPGMMRYFMTVQEAVSLVLQAASRSERAIYTLDMGSPVKILDLAENMIAQSGSRPYVDIPIVFTGTRPGEKLFEEIDVSEKSAYKTDMAKIYITRLDAEKQEDRDRRSTDRASASTP